MRHIPEAGAVCGNSARTDLCGGRGVTSVPTATATRMKLLVHDGFGVWCAARRLNQGRFAWPREGSEAASPMTLTQPQFNALVLGLPWQRLEQMQVITRM